MNGWAEYTTALFVGVASLTRVILIVVPSSQYEGRGAAEVSTSEGMSPLAETKYRPMHSSIDADNSIRP